MIISLDIYKISFWFQRRRPHKLFWWKSLFPWSQKNIPSSNRWNVRIGSDNSWNPHHHDNDDIIDHAYLDVIHIRWNYNVSNIYSRVSCKYISEIAHNDWQLQIANDNRIIQICGARQISWSQLSIKNNKKRNEYQQHGHPTIGSVTYTIILRTYHAPTLDFLRHKFQWPNYIWLYHGS